MTYSYSITKFLQWHTIIITLSKYFINVIVYIKYNNKRKRQQIQDPLNSIFILLQNNLNRYLLTFKYLISSKFELRISIKKNSIVVYTRPYSVSILPFSFQHCIE